MTTTISSLIWMRMKSSRRSRTFRCLHFRSTPVQRLGSFWHLLLAHAAVNDYLCIFFSFSFFLRFCRSPSLPTRPCSSFFFPFFFFFLPLFLSLSLPSLTLQLFLYIVNFLFLVNYIKEREKSALTFKLHECLCEIACDPLFVAVVSCRLFFFFVSSLCSSPIVSRFTHKSNLETTPVY